VLVNSEWSADALVQQGVPRAKIIVVPHAYERRSTPAQSRATYDGSRPLRVLFLGSVLLRKGIPYLMGAARELGDAVDVRVVGPLDILPHAVARAPDNMEFFGQVPRLQCEQHWQWADVFVLPTMSDGFAITQLEAMDRGLPAVTTRRCGRVVQHEHNGLLVEAGSVESLAEALQRLADDPQLVGELSEHAARTVEDYTLESYADQVLAGIGADAEPGEAE
jgi:glycosyltransferase involved in cell wall biosynthesis